MENPKLRIGVAGLGRAFSLMLPTFLNDDRVALVAACDPREQARNQFVKDFQAPVYPDIDALVKNEDVQVVYVASPHQFHAEHTCIAAQHGKHVLVEKPMALSLDECDQMIDACQSSGVQLMVGHCHSFDEPYLQARRAIASGVYGQVRMVHATNYTDYLFRPRRPEELDTKEGGGAVFSQAAHQVDIVRMLVGERPVRLRSALGRWDRSRPTEGAYSALLWFESGAFASLSYNGYGHFDSDEWMGWVGEMGKPKQPQAYGAARRKLATLSSPVDEARLKAAGTYGGADYVGPNPASSFPDLAYQHFGPIIISCDHADLRPLPNGIEIYGDSKRDFIALPQPRAPRLEVIDELYAAIYGNTPCLHDGNWARSTLEICLSMLESDANDGDVLLATPR